MSKRKSGRKPTASPATSPAKSSAPKVNKSSALQRFSAPILLRLHGMPRWLFPIFTALLLVGGLLINNTIIATALLGALTLILLWLVALGCAIKVAAQVEIGRNTLTWGRTPLAAFDTVPGPRMAGRGWIYWGWAVMTTLIIVQQGGILAGVAQTLAAGLPLTATGREWNRVHDAVAATRIAEATARRGGDAVGADALHDRLAALEEESRGLTPPVDWTLWAVVTAVVTAALLAVGRYGVIERVSITP